MSIKETYHITTQLNTGSRRKFGLLYEAKNKSTSERVILKVLPITDSNKHLATRLKHEASFSFNFDGLPKTLAFEESKHEVILVRRFVDGIPLDEFWKTIKRRERIPMLKTILSQMVSIFEQLQTLQIVHADIKPSNILLHPETHKVHLIDFGLALKTKQPEQRDFLFPLGYAAPELLLNRLHLVDQRTDIFALGILIWRIWVGKLPLTHPNPSIFTNLQLTHPLPESPEIPKGLFRILQKMTAKHSFKLPPNKMDITTVDHCLSNAMNERYKNLNDVLNDLNQLSDRNRFLPKNIFSKS